MKITRGMFKRGKAFRCDTDKKDEELFNTFKNSYVIEYEIEKYEIEKANKHISELEAVIKHLKGSNGNKQNRIKNLESKLEEINRQGGK